MKQSTKKKPTTPFGGKCIRAQGGGWVYLSFQDKEVFQGLDLPQEEGDGSPTIAVVAVTEISDIADIPEASPAPKTISKYPGWETVLHSSQPVYAAGETPHQPLSLDQEEDREYLPIPPQLPVHPVHLKLCCHQCLLLPHRH